MPKREREDPNTEESLDVKLVSEPPGQGASHVLDRGEARWLSPMGHTRENTFVFEARRPCTLSRFEWKGANGAGLPKRLSLSAQDGTSWIDIATWEALNHNNWQVAELSKRVESMRWRLTLIGAHGNPQTVGLQAVKFFGQHILPQIYSKFWADRAFPDIEMVVGERRFPTHRGLLAAASPVFAAMLHSEMREAKVGEIRLEDTDELSVHTTLEYIYTGVLAEDVQFGVLLLAHKYEIEGLAELAAPAALQKVTKENVVAGLRMLKAYASGAKLGAVWQRLLTLVRESPELFTAAMLELL